MADQQTFESQAPPLGESLTPWAMQFAGDIMHATGMDGFAAAEVILSPWHWDECLLLEGVDLVATYRLHLDQGAT